MKKTDNYSLPQWEKQDFIKMEDFNDAFGKTDAALKAHDTALKANADATATGLRAETAARSEAVAALSKNLGAAGHNCRIAVGSYTGTGTYGQNNAVSIACDFYPVVLLVAPLDDSPVKNPRIMVRGRTSGTIRPEGGSNFNLTVVWKDAGISWYNATATNANQQLNNDESYCYVVLGYDKVKENS